MTSRLVPLASFLLLVASMATAQGPVLVCPLNGMVDDGMRVFVHRALEEAAGAQALIFEIDTPGGRIDSAIDISNAIISSPVRTIAYIKGMGAISAGALISYSCKEIVMAPEANIGAATPVLATPEGMMPTGEKEVSYMRARMRSLAERTGRNPALAEAMVDKDIELHAYTDGEGKLQVYAVYGKALPEPPAEAEVPATRQPRQPDPADVVRKVFDMSIQTGARAQLQPNPAGVQAPAATPSRPEGDIILPAGKLLTLTPQEALKYGLIPAILSTRQEVLFQYGYERAEVRELALSMGEKLFRWLTNPVVAGLLLMLGIGGIYLELKTPGFGLPGILGIICLSLFFGAHMVIGIANWIDVILVVTGLALIVVELFVLPGFGVVGSAGILCLLIGIYLTLVTTPIPEFSWEYDRMTQALQSLLVATVSLGVLIYALWKYLPRTALYSRLVLTHAQLPAQGYTVQTAQDEEAVVGQQGVAVSLLRPVGRARFGDKTLQVVSRSEYIEPGASIVIVQVDGNRYVVDRVEDTQ